MSELDILRYAINNAEEEIAVFELDGSLIYANELTMVNHALMKNFSANSIADFNIVEFKGNRWLEVIEEIRESKDKSIKMQVSKELRDKTMKYYEIKGNITTAGEHDAVWFFANDITLRVTQQNKVKELNYVMDAILSNIPVYLFVKDSANDFRYIYWNKAFENFSKIPSSKALGSTDYEIFPNRADAEKFRLDDLMVLHKGSSIEFDEEYIDAEGSTRHVHTLKALIKTDKMLPWLMGVTWDITDLKRTEKELILARTKAEQSDRLKSAFLANMSHEIRTPLNAIVGFSRLLGDTTEEERVQYQNIIEDNANLLLQLINDILDISKIEAGTLEFIDSTVKLNDLFHDIYEMQSLRVNSDVRLVYEDNVEQLNLRCDRNRLLQVVTNLINNAIKFTHNGEIKFGFVRNSTDIVFYVKDSGIGISKKDIDGIFNRFTKLNSFIQGTGLGLSICQTIVDKMQGRIWVESEEGVGSTFYFSIPFDGEYIVENEVVNVVPSRKGSHTKRKDRKTVLIAEDVDSSFILLDSLLSHRCDIVRAFDGCDAVDKFEKYAPDLILMDIKMPRMDGLEATRVIRQASDVPIVAVTSSAYESDRSAAIESGCDSFIVKPVSVEALHKVLQKYL